MSDGAERYDAVVVGAGFAGMYMLHRLRRSGLSVRVFETASGVGGTWFWNRYPGARCDIRTLDYSYSFDPDLEQEWDWSEKFATQPEILRYANHVADRYDLRRDITFDTRVLSAVYDEDGNTWTVTTDRAGVVTARYLVMATGCLSTAKDPELPGLGSFRGPTYHTGRWPADGVDLSGQRVGVIGTGSSGIQSIPLMASEAGHLTVFQRTPNFSLPALNGPIDPDEVAAVKADYREYRRLARLSRAGAPGVLPTQSALEVDDDARNARYEQGWQAGNLGGILAAYTDLMIDPAANETAAEFVRSKIRQIVKDPAVAEALCPTSFPFGTKRPCLDTGYYETFNRPNVTLVDLRATPLVEIVPEGVRTAAGVHELDVLVFATGFDAMTGALTSIDIRGRDGRALADEWAHGPRSYLGIAVAGFPNMFTITGPGSPSVLSNMMVSIEQHVEWVADCVDHLEANGYDRIEADADAQAEWMDHVQVVASFTLYPRAASWYMGANVEGKTRVFMPYIGGVGPYREKCDEIAAAGYTGFDLRPAPQAATVGGRPTPDGGDRAG